MSVQTSLDVPLSHEEQSISPQHFYMAEVLLRINSSLPKMQLHSGKQQLGDEFVPSAAAGGAASPQRTE